MDNKSLMPVVKLKEASFDMLTCYSNIDDDYYLNMLYSFLEFSLVKILVSKTQIITEHYTDLFSII